MTATAREGGPPRPALHIGETSQSEDRDAENLRRTCAAFIYENGERVPCPWRGVMLWFGVVFCPTHSPRRQPGMPGWERI